MLGWAPAAVRCLPREHVAQIIHPISSLPPFWFFITGGRKLVPASVKQADALSGWAIPARILKPIQLKEN